MMSFEDYRDQVQGYPSNNPQSCILCDVDHYNIYTCSPCWLQLTSGWTNGDEDPQTLARHIYDRALDRLQDKEIRKMLVSR